MSETKRNECTVPPPCSALVKQAERVLKYLREIGQQTREEITFPSADYADAMADDLEYALKQNAEANGRAVAHTVQPIVGSSGEDNA